MAWHSLGWEPAFFSEIEKFPSAVLALHYPDVPNHGDMTRFKDWPDHAIDLLVGGTPCQSFSVAGLRKGLADPRGNLMLTYLAILERFKPRWCIWENVPGVLSSSGGRDFGAFLGGLGQLGYGIAYRVLDAQYVRTCDHAFAVPQRRRRVFVVGYLGDWRRAAAVLFDRESLSGNPAPRREAGKGIAPSLAARTRGGGGLGTDAELDGALLAVSNPLTARMHKGINTTLDEGQTLITEARQQPQVVAFDCKGTEVHFTVDGSHPTLRSMGHNKSHQNAGGHEAVAHALKGEGFDASEDGTGRGTPVVPVAFDPNQITSKVNRSIPRGDRLHTLPAASMPPMLAAPWAVRRLTPRECHRLQAFPDDFCNIPWRGKSHAPDGHQYKALGNSMAVNVMRWLGDRIELVEAMK